LRDSSEGKRKTGKRRKNQVEKGGPLHYHVASSCIHAVARVTNYIDARGSDERGEDVLEKERKKSTEGTKNFWEYYPLTRTIPYSEAHKRCS